jgi:hypothetical protein
MYDAEYSSLLSNQTIQLATVSCNNRTNEIITLIKSVLIFSDYSHIDFHIFVDIESYSEIDNAVRYFFEKMIKF